MRFGKLNYAGDAEQSGNEESLAEHISFAQPSHSPKGGSPLDQIQLSLGHSSIQTTERYIGAKQNFHDAPCDRLGLEDF